MAHECKKVSCNHVTGKIITFPDPLLQVFPLHYENHCDDQQNNHRSCNKGHNQNVVNRRYVISWLHTGNFLCTWVTQQHINIQVDALINT